MTKNFWCEHARVIGIQEYAELDPIRKVRNSSISIGSLFFVIVIEWCIKSDSDCKVSHMYYLRIS